MEEILQTVAIAVIGYILFVYIVRKLEKLIK